MSFCATAALLATLSFPHWGCPGSTPCITMPESLVLGLNEFMLDGSIVLERPMAPELILMPRDECKSPECRGWKLSSNALPPSITAIPLSALAVEVHVD